MMAQSIELARLDELLQGKSWSEEVGGAASRNDWSDDILAEYFKNAGVPELTRDQERAMFLSILESWITGDTSTYKASHMIYHGGLRMIGPEGEYVFFKHFSDGITPPTFIGWETRTGVAAVDLQDREINFEGYLDRAEDDPILTAPIAASVPAHPGAPKVPEVPVDVAKKSTNRESVNNFYKSVKALLLDDVTYPEGVQVMGWSCLVMWRGCVKTEAQCAGYFHSRMTGNFNQIYQDSSFNGVFVATHRKFTTQVCTQFAKGSRMQAAAFAKAVEAAMNQKYVGSMMRATCLLHTAGNGLGLIHLFDGVCRKLGQSHATILRAFATTITLIRY